MFVCCIRLRIIRIINVCFMWCMITLKKKTWTAYERRKGKQPCRQVLKETFHRSGIRGGGLQILRFWVLWVHFLWHFQEREREREADGTREREREREANVWKSMRHSDRKCPLSSEPLNQHVFRWKISYSRWRSTAGGWPANMRCRCDRTTGISSIMPAVSKDCFRL